MYVHVLRVLMREWWGVSGVPCGWFPHVCHGLLSSGTFASAALAPGPLGCGIALSCACLLQRVAAWYILCELYRNDGYATNPFLPVFVENFRRQTSVPEKHFLALLLSSTASNKEVSVRLLPHMGVATCSVWCARTVVCTRVRHPVALRRERCAGFPGILRLALSAVVLPQLAKKSSRQVQADFSSHAVMSAEDEPDLNSLLRVHAERSPAVAGALRAWRVYGSARLRGVGACVLLRLCIVGDCARKLEPLWVLCAVAMVCVLVVTVCVCGGGGVGLRLPGRLAGWLENVNRCHASPFPLVLAGGCGYAGLSKAHVRPVVLDPQLEPGSLHSSYVQPLNPESPLAVADIPGPPLRGGAPDSARGGGRGAGSAVGSGSGSSSVGGGPSSSSTLDGDSSDGVCDLPALFSLRGTRPCFARPVPPLLEVDDFEVRARVRGCC